MTVSVFRLNFTLSFICIISFYYRFTTVNSVGWRKYLRKSFSVSKRNIYVLNNWKWTRLKFESFVDFSYFYPNFYYYAFNFEKFKDVEIYPNLIKILFTTFYARLVEMYFFFIFFWYFSFLFVLSLSLFNFKAITIRLFFECSIIQTRGVNRKQSELAFRFWYGRVDRTWTFRLTRDTRYIRMS